MKRLPRRLIGTILTAVLLTALAGCATVRELAALRSVTFDLDNVSGATLVGVNLQEIKSLSAVRPAQLIRLTQAVRDRSLPLSFTLHVAAENPGENDVQARLVGLDWTLLVEDKETISGSLAEPVSLPPGQPVDIPLGIELDLYQFFDANLADMFELALNIAGAGGQPKQLKLLATPTVQTPIGPIRYPGRIEVLDRRVGKGS